MDLKDTWDKYYEKYKKVLGSANAFFELIKLRKASPFRVERKSQLNTTSTLKNFYPTP